MKKFIISLVAVVACLSANAQKVILYNGSQVVATYTKAEVDKVVFSPLYAPDANGKSYVDLGVEVDGKPVYFANSNLADNGLAPEQYMAGGRYNYETAPQLNVATILGGTWSLDCAAAFEVLCGPDYTWEVVSISGVKGMKVMKIGENNDSNYLFLPFAGNVTPNDTYWAGTKGHYILGNGKVLFIWNTFNQEKPEYSVPGKKILNEADMAEGNSVPGISIRPVLKVE